MFLLETRLKSEFLSLWSTFWGFWTIHLQAFLLPSQVGVDTTLGFEAVIHATHYFMDQSHSNTVSLKLDIKNAFNSICRDTLLQEAQSTSQKSVPSYGIAILQKIPLSWKLLEIDGYVGLAHISGRYLSFTNISVLAKTVHFIGLSQCWQNAVSYSSPIQTTCARKHNEPSQDSYLAATLAGVVS